MEIKATTHTVVVDQPAERQQREMQDINHDCTPEWMARLHLIQKQTRIRRVLPVYQQFDSIEKQLIIFSL